MSRVFGSARVRGGDNLAIATACAGVQSWSGGRNRAWAIGATEIKVVTRQPQWAHSRLIVEASTRCTYDEGTTGPSVALAQSGLITMELIWSPSTSNAMSLVPLKPPPLTTSVTT